MTTAEEITTEWLYSLPLLTQSNDNRGRHWRADVDHTGEYPKIGTEGNMKEEPPSRRDAVRVAIDALLAAIFVQVMGALTFFATSYSYRMWDVWGVLGSIPIMTFIAALTLILLASRGKS